MQSQDKTNSIAVLSKQQKKDLFICNCHQTEWSTEILSTGSSFSQQFLLAWLSILFKWMFRHPQSGLASILILGLSPTSARSPLTDFYFYTSFPKGWVAHQGDMLRLFSVISSVSDYYTIANISSYLNSRKSALQGFSRILGVCSDAALRIFTLQVLPLPLQNQCNCWLIEDHK